MLFSYLYHGDLYTLTCGKSDLYFRPANAERSFDSNSTNTFYEPDLILMEITYWRICLWILGLKGLTSMTTHEDLSLGLLRTNPACGP